MTELTTFHYHDAAVRMQQSASGEPLFCLADVCGVLEISNPSMTAAQIKEEFGSPKLNLGLVMDANNHAQQAIFITEPQLYFVMMRSRSDKARPFRQWVVSEVLPAIRKTGRYEAKAAPQPQTTPAAIPLKDLIEVTKIVLEPAGIEGNQLALALDKVVKTKTGESALTLAGVQLVAPTQEQLLTPTDLGKPLGLSARAVNKKLVAIGYQTKTDNGWELTEAGKRAGGVYLDVGKRHNNGTPVRQLKWPANIASQLSA